MGAFGSWCARTTIYSNHLVIRLLWITLTTVFRCCDTHYQQFPFKRMAAWKSRFWTCWGSQIMVVIANEWSRCQTSSWKVRDHLRLISVCAEWMGLAHGLGSFHFGHWFISTWKKKKTKKKKKIGCNLTIGYNSEGFSGYHWTQMGGLSLSVYENCTFMQTSMSFGVCQ